MPALLSHFLPLTLRTLSAIFSAIALALSVVLIHQAKADYKNTLISFCAFCGALGIIVAVMGAVASFIEKVPKLVVMGVDALTVLFFIGGGCAMAAQLTVHTCAAEPGELKDMGWKNVGKHVSLYTALNPIVNGGYAYDTNFDFVGRCEMAQADCAFLFFALGGFIGCLVMDFFAGKTTYKLGKGGVSKVGV